MAATAVPEPFTIIGTIIGGTAAFRMRKKLSNSVKN
ncbi:MAG: PEP-CTERM sorting domain-containing protein [Chamaesiphon sp.]|nr:PEP-CTERM sorting domain-containing protein [Chamaesiphon sp.]